MVKDFTKAAFGVGLGFTLGKLVGDMIVGSAGKVLTERMVSKAKEGNEFAQTVCEKAGVKFTEEPSEDDTEIKNKIGFSR